MGDDAPLGQGPARAAAQDQAAWIGAPSVQQQEPRAKTTEEIVEQEAAMQQAAKDTSAWMAAPGIATESRAKTTEEIVAEAKQQQDLGGQSGNAATAGGQPPPMPEKPEGLVLPSGATVARQASLRLRAFLEVDEAAWRPMLEMCVLMLMWGLANNANDILIKQFKKVRGAGRPSTHHHHSPLTTHRLAMQCS